MNVNKLRFMLYIVLYIISIHFIEHWKNGIICEQLFVNIMSDVNKKSILCVARFLKHAFDLRNAQLVETLN